MDLAFWVWCYKPDDDAGEIDTLVSAKVVARSLAELLVKPQ
jgi:hypothetical protein